MQDADERFRPVLEEMRRQVEAGLRPSIQVAVDWRGERVLDAALGAGATPRSAYVLWSTTKPLVAAALPDALRARVLDPAGIAADGFSLGTPERLAAPPLPVHTRGVRGAPPPAEAEFWSDPATHAAVIPGAGGIARAGEIVRFYRALLQGGAGPGGRLLSPAMVRTATFPHAVGTVDRTFLRDIPWGLGFHLKHVRPSLDDCGRSATPGTFGHGGHFLVNTAWADPGKDLACCILSNGLAEPRAGVRAVQALSQAVHDVVDREMGSLDSRATFWKAAGEVQDR